MPCLRRLKRFASGLTLLFGAASSALCQTSVLDWVVPVSATTGSASPYVTLRWPASSSTAQNGWRRAKGATSWNAFALAANAVSYPDVNAQPGIAYEYSLQFTLATGITAYGSIVAGYNIPIVEQRGNVILLVDSTIKTPLAAEIARLQQDLAADGWIVFKHDVPRQKIEAFSALATDSPKRLAEISAVRTIVQNDYNTAPAADWALFILGRIPVPYSGKINPDGHAEHLGAWPADVYYGDMSGTWTDNSVTATGATSLRNHNIPGDGKFDQSTIPADVKLEVGRVDLYYMSRPTGKYETDMLRQYLVRDHNFRWAIAPFNAVARKGYVADVLGTVYNEAFASSGWRTSYGLFGVNQSNETSDWFGDVGTTPCLFASAFGWGAWNFCAAVSATGTSDDFNTKDSKAVFNMMFGSYFGDWDSGPDGSSFLRAPLGGTPNSLSLCNVWSGRGSFQLFHMGLGETVGYGVRYTQNARQGAGDWVLDPNNGGSYARLVHYALMGDPTLRLHVVAPPLNCAATSSTNSITLTWTASSDAAVSGYHVYRSTSAAGPFVRITGDAATGANPTGTPLSSTTTTYTDNDASLVTGNSYTYLVKAVKIETSPSGTYANQSSGAAVTIAKGAVGVISPAINNNSFRFNETAGIIKYTLIKPAPVSVKLFDLQGKTVVSFVNNIQAPGNYALKLPIASLARSLYIAEFRAGDFVKKEAMAITK
ncbi:MAG: fibronectin type III domain-containing protein [Chitinivibrionales bacterium]|nr:fibronectin type III domain-containing protein [Chitinivibrionales bacterium]